MSRPSASEDVFRAVADPTRRAVLELLGQRDELTVTELAERLRVSMPLLSRHLAVLRAAQLVAERPVGRQRLYRLRPEPLRELYDWAAVFTDFWSDRLHGLSDFLRRDTPTGQHLDPASQHLDPASETTGDSDHDA